MLKKSVYAVIGSCLWIGAASAVPIQWTAGPGANGHFYEAISAPNMTWTQAQAAAVAAGGYLATITSADENNFVFNTFGIADRPYWLGGYQPNGQAEPAGGWQWVTGETWSYTNWAGGEPNNGSCGSTPNCEGSLAFAFFTADGRWNDAPTGYTGYGNGGYVIESVPEPATLSLLGLGLVGLGFARRRKQQA